MARGRGRLGDQNGTSSTATRARILDATLETIRTEGMLGTSARAIARTGNFNQASIYYHFGSIDDVVLAALRALSEQRLQRYAGRLASVSSLASLLELGADLHREDTECATMLVLAQVMSAAAADNGFAKEVGEIFRPWIEELTALLRRLLGGGPLLDALPVEELAYALSALLVGTEMIDRLRPLGDGRSVWAAVGAVARLLESLVGTASTVS